MKTLVIAIAPDGSAKMIYDDDLVDVMSALGQATVSRASHVEPHPDGGWVADLAPSGGPVLGPFQLRQAALDAEREWLEKNVLS